MSLVRMLEWLKQVVDTLQTIWACLLILLYLRPFPLKNICLHPPALVVFSGDLSRRDLYGSTLFTELNSDRRQCFDVRVDGRFLKVSSCCS